MMTPENQKRHDEKQKRMKDALALREPDRVPLSMGGGTFMFKETNYTVAQSNYDESMDMIKEAAVKFLKKYDPDTGTGTLFSFAGEGPGHEMQQLSTLFIAGMKDAPITMPANSGPQFLESPKLPDEELGEFIDDYTLWSLRRYLPRLSKVFEPFKTFSLPLNHRNINDVVNQFSRPDIRAAIEKMWEIDDFYKAYRAKASKIDRELAEMGYPSFGGGGRAVVPFDKYSDTFRGTVLSLMDLYDCPDDVMKYMETFQKDNLQGIRDGNKDGKRNGRFMSMALHKGFDGMLNDEQYEKYYWRHLKECIDVAREVNLIPQVFCEGKYMTRLKYIADITPGNVYYTFEDMDMKATKQALAGKACIGGGFPSPLLHFGTKQQVIDTAKKMIDDCAPGGGYIFGLSAGLSDEAKVENVEALVDTVKTYGKY